MAVALSRGVARSVMANRVKAVGARSVLVGNGELAVSWGAAQAWSVLVWRFRCVAVRYSVV